MWGWRLPCGKNYYGAKDLQAAHRQAFREASALCPKHFMCPRKERRAGEKSKNLTDCPGRGYWA
ncbi:hypothetical protein D5272_13875 [bacterium D16-76]|nr:hypothetical protein [bacterium D16-76]